MKFRRVGVFLSIVLACALVISGCSAKSASDRLSVQETEKEASVPAREAGGNSDAFGSSNAVSDLGSATDRMIIRTVDMSLVVEDTDVTVAAVQEQVKGYGGYVADSRRWFSNEQPYANMTIRVPAGDLDAFLDAIRGMAIRVESESSSGQDVTEEYADLDARLRNLEATETELRELLTEVRENRGKAEEILQIHRELTNIRSQIESLKGRQQYLERMTALSTIQLSIRPKEAPKSVTQDSWNPLVTLSNAVSALLGFLRVIGDLLIYLVIFGIVLAIPVVALIFLVRALKRRKSRTK